MTAASEILAQLRCGGSGCTCARNGTVHCPAHDDEHPSLSVSEENGKVLVHCHGGCDQDRVIEALRNRGLWQRQAPRPSASVSGVNAVTPSPSGLTIEQLAAAKRLPASHLRHCGLGEWHPSVGRTIITIPYRDHEGREVAVRFRQAITGADRFFWRRKDRPLPYGLGRLEDARAVGWLLVVEGESDCWTGWLYGIPTLGLPGKSTWQSDFAPALRGLQVFIWQEPDAEDFSERIGKDIPDARIILAPDGIKDLSDAHVQGLDVLGLLEGWKAEAVPVSVRVQERHAAGLAAEASIAESVLSEAEPLRLVERAGRALGYGGDAKPLLLTYIAVSSRLLAMRFGQMPVHLVLGGSASGGKSFTLSTVLRLHPASAYHVIDAGSPRVLIYDAADLQHRAVVFGEADSLPAGEDNPAASAIRNLCTDHHLHYQATVRDSKTGTFTVKDIDKPGPTVLITTSVRQLGEQLESRLFRLEVPDDQDSIRAALLAQAAVEASGAAEPDPALIAAQAYLQRLAPWDVVVPFAAELATLIGRRPAGPRIKRDYARLLSLIKAHAILCHRHRERDASGRLVAEIGDYATVFTLVNDVYQGGVNGASTRIREVVEAVQELRGEQPVRVSAIAKHLGINQMAANRRVKAAIRSGFLVNQESRSRQPAILELGDPLPPDDGLPRPEALSVNALTPDTDDKGQGGEHPEADERDTPDLDPSVSGVNALTLPHDASHRGGCADCGGPTAGPTWARCAACLQRRLNGGD